MAQITLPWMGWVLVKAMLLSVALTYKKLTLNTLAWMGWDLVKVMLLKTLAWKGSRV
jgi:hypothetical protein